MQAVTTIGLDIAKSVFQVHGIDAEGKVLIRRKLKRRDVLAFFQKLSPCLVGIEACATSHHWSRELKALGHTVRLMPPAYVKPYGVKRINATFVGGKQMFHGRSANEVGLASASIVLSLVQRLVKKGTLKREDALALLGRCR
jgi:hypothetical protein